jgi:hypothetical protein
MDPIKNCEGVNSRDTYNIGEQLKTKKKISSMDPIKNCEGVNSRGKDNIGEQLKTKEKNKQHGSHQKL